MIRRIRFARMCALVLFILYWSIGCGGAKVKQSFPAQLDKTTMSTIRSVGVSKDIRFPERMTVLATHKKASQGIIGHYVAGQFEDHWSDDFDRMIKEKVDIQQYFSQSFYTKFVSGLKGQQIFANVPQDDNAPLDSEFVLNVEDYGLDPLRKTPGRGPYIRVSAMMVANPPYVLVPSQKYKVSLEPENPTQNPVYWYRQIRVCNPKDPIFPMYEMEEYVRDPDLLKQVFDMAIQVAVEDLMKNMKLP
jgi:hypothetical protein